MRPRSQQHEWLLRPYESVKYLWGIEILKLAEIFEFENLHFVTEYVYAGGCVF